MEAGDRLVQMREALTRQALDGDSRAKKLLTEMGFELKQEEPVLTEISESLNSAEVQSEVASLLSEQQMVISEPVQSQPEPVAAPIPSEPEPVAAQEPEIIVKAERKTEEIANDLTAANEKKGRLTSKERAEAKQRLRDDGVNIDLYLRQSELDLENSKDDQIIFGRRRADLRELAEAIRSGNLTEEQIELMDRINLKIGNLGRVDTQVELTEPEIVEAAKPTLESVIGGNEENYNKLFLNTKREANDGRQDEEERISSKSILEVAGYDMESLNELDDRVKLELAQGVSRSLNEMFAQAQRVYLRHTVGVENLTDLTNRGQEIDGLLGENLNANREIQSLLKKIVTISLDIRRGRNWRDVQQKRLAEYLKSGFLGGEKINEAKRDKYSREIRVEEGEDQMLLRGAVVEVVGGASMNVEANDLYDRVKSTFLARKGISIGVLRSKDEAIVKAEIRARLELHQSSLFWNGMKDDQKPDADKYDAMKSGLARMPLLSEETYRWLMDHEADSSYIYIDSKTGEKQKVECENLRAEMDDTLKKIFDYISSEGGGDVWSKTMNYDQRIDLFKQLGIRNENVGMMSLQLAEAECWTAMRPGSYHPVRRLAYLSDYRMERFSKSLSVPGGYRLVQEYRDTHGGALPFDKDNDDKVINIREPRLFDAEGVSLARLGLDMNNELRNNVSSGKYLEKLKDLYDSPNDDIRKKIKSSQFNMRAELSLSANVYDAFDALAKPIVGLDTLGKLRGSMFPWYVTRFGSSNLQSGVSEMSLEYTKTYLWANSLANNIRNLDGSKIVDMKKFVEETYIPLLDAIDPNTGTGFVASADISDKRLIEIRRSRVGMLPVSESSDLVPGVGASKTRRQQISELNAWFENLVFEKCYPILETVRRDNSIKAVVEGFTGLNRGLNVLEPEKMTLPDYLLRADRNTPALEKLKQESVGFKESLQVKLRNLMKDRNKWWNNPAIVRI